MEPAQVFRLANSSSNAIREKWAGNRAREVVEDTREGGGAEEQNFMLHLLFSCNRDWHDEPCPAWSTVAAVFDCKVP